MAGIEPASERFVPRTSTSVVPRFSRRTVLKGPRTGRPATEARKLLFRTFSCLLCGTPAFLRPLYLRLEDGVGERGLTSETIRFPLDYAASGRAA